MKKVEEVQAEEREFSCSLIKPKFMIGVHPMDVILLNSSSKIILMA
jgi:hypothetical protein